MTRAAENVTKEEKIVVFFDMCSSTRILEDLISIGHLNVFRNVLIATKKFLQGKAIESSMDIYKFVGDGWVLLFPNYIPGKKLIETLTELSCFFHAQLDSRIEPLLQNTPKVMGLTFGIDMGTVVRMVMLGKREYIGRPLNVASRLQGAIKDRDKKPAYKVLLTKHAFKVLDLDRSKAKLVTRNLRNIFGGERYECMKLSIKIPSDCKESRRRLQRSVA